MRKILITGASGKIGKVLTEHFAGKYDLRLSDIKPQTESKGIPFVQADISNFEAMQNLCRGIDTVIHLAADPSIHAQWESLLPNNIIGLYNIFQAALEAGCRRVIFASSVNAVLAYPEEVSVKEDLLAKPSNLYGASKVWGEGVASVYAYQKGLSSLCLRFGWVARYDSPHVTLDNSLLGMLLTYRDLVKLVEAAVLAPDDVQFGVFHGVSNNRKKRLDITAAREVLGYAPEDDAYALAEANSER